jgi:putative transposase
LIVLPETKKSLNLAVGKAHRRYTRRINFREGWRGHLWQGRFASFILDQRYLLACTKYMVRSPWRKFLTVDAQGAEMALFRKHERTGRPLGDDVFIENLEQLLDRKRKPQKPGPKVGDK